MVEKKDVAMNAFPQVTDAEYIYAEAADGSQVKIKKSDLYKKAGLFRIGRTFTGGEQVEIPFTGGLVIVQNGSFTHSKSLAIVNGGNSGDVIIPDGYINYFSEVENRICIFNTGVNTNYIVKNGYSSDMNVYLLFLGI